MYKRLRYGFRFTTTLLSKYYLVIILGLVLGIGSFILIPRLLGRLTFFKPVQKIAITGRYTFIDLPPEITSKISIGLTTLDPSGLPGPGIASEWVATDSGKTYSFTIKPDLKWQDGTSVISSDLDLKFKDAQVSFPTDSQVIITLPDAYAPLPVVVSRPVFKLNAKNITGLGAYKVSGFQRNGTLLESLTLTPVSEDLPRLKYLFYPTATLARTAFKLGLVQQVVELTDPSFLVDWPNTNLTVKSEVNRYVAVFFNLDHPDFLGQSGRYLRLALAYATDKSNYPVEQRATGPISPDSWAYNFEVKPYEEDLVRAKDLITKVEKVPEELSLHTVPAYFQQAEKIKTNWERLGFKVNLTVTSEVPEDYQALIIAQSVPVDPDQYNLWHSTQKGTSITNLNNPRIDVLLERGRKTLDRQERREIYLDFQKFLAQEVPAIFLFYPESYTISRK